VSVDPGNDKCVIGEIVTMQVYKKCMVYVSMFRMALEPGNNILKGNIL
jgi:hypothetical protein